MWFSQPGNFTGSGSEGVKSPVLSLPKLCFVRPLDLFKAELSPAKCQRGPGSQEVGVRASGLKAGGGELQYGK